jgi:hypothetical protein
MATEGSDDDADEAVKAFRPDNRLVTLTLGANLLLAGLFLGVPYYRGHLRAQESLSTFGRFAGCLLGAEPQRSRGLGMPPGERNAFAAQVLRAGADWPRRCEPLLARIAPEDAIFLWPSVKVAGADVRAVVRLLDQELLVLVRARAKHAAGRIPERPLLALSKLRAALTLYARAAGADESLDSDAVKTPTRATIPEPARLPLTAAASAALQVWAGEDGLRAIAMDARGISWLHVQDGKVDRNRVKRTSLVRMPIHTAEAPLLVWAMSQERCAREPDHCARRTSAVAPFEENAARLPEPTWLGGHPAGRADRTLRPGLDKTLDVLARADALGALEVRRFQLGGDAARTPVLVGSAATVDDEPAPLVPIERFPVPASVPAADALLLHGGQRAVAYVTSEGSVATGWLWPYHDRQIPIALGTTTGQGAWLAACEGLGGDVILFGTESALAITRVASDGIAVPLLATTPMAVGMPVHAEDPAQDRMRMLCSADQAIFLFNDVKGGLRALRCDAHTCQEGPLLAHDVDTFDAAAAGAHVLVAYTRKREPQLAVIRLSTNLQRSGSPQVPAACWDPAGGMCGQPTLVADSGRLLLCARDGTDLLAIESDDEGKSWKPMSGLKVSTAISTDVSAPMDQHRLRKGID